MTYKPHLRRKLYKTTLKKENIVHPTLLPSQPGPGKDEEFVPPVNWHFDGDKVYVTFWSEYKSKYNESNKNKFVIADDAAINAVKAMYEPLIREQKDRAVTDKYNASELAVPTDEIKADITALHKAIDDKWAEVWNVE